jgi:hypothetical protein
LCPSGGKACEDDGSAEIEVTHRQYGGARMSVREGIEGGEAQLCTPVSIGAARRSPFREHIGGQCQPPNFYLARVQYTFDSQPPTPSSTNFLYSVRHPGRSQRKTLLSVRNWNLEAVHSVRI